MPKSAATRSPADKPPAKNSTAKRATIRNVALEAGVSVAAVSKVLRNAYGVSDEMRAKVTRAMEKLGYRPQTTARGMRGRTFRIGVVLPDLRNPFFATILEGVTAELAPRGYHPVIAVGRPTIEAERQAVEAMIDSRMDALLMISPRPSVQKLNEISAQIPAAMIGHYPSKGLVGFDTVNGDDVQGARLATRHLIDQGIEDIHFLAIETAAGLSDSFITRREDGYRQTMREAGLGAHIRVVEAPPAGDRLPLVLRDYLGSKSRPRGLFCWTDYVALHVLSVAVELGLRIPEDLAVIGYDNSPFCALGQNSLTTIDQHGQELGAAAARALLERIDGRTEPRDIVLPVALVTRRSTGAGAQRTTRSRPQRARKA